MNLFPKNSRYAFKAFLIFCLIAGAIQAQAAKVDTINTFSAAMNKTIKAVVILPDDYNKAQRFSTVYLLHGYGGNYSDYISKVPAIKKYADDYKLIIVCADGNKSSWYFDSPEDKAWKYETYVSKELVSWIDKHYKTVPDKKNRAITGLSMGGHGALSIAIKHQDVFGAAGSMSGGLDLRPFSGNWDISKRLGSLCKVSPKMEREQCHRNDPLVNFRSVSFDHRLWKRRFLLPGE